MHPTAASGHVELLQTLIHVTVVFGRLASKKARAAFEQQSFIAFFALSL
jgi:hypothetical protein